MRHAHVRLLAAVPIIALIAALPLVNRVEPLVFGLPFVLFWILAWVVATPACLGLAYFLVRSPKSEVRGRPNPQADGREPRRSAQREGGGR
jgi:hypothetical protein